MNDALYFLLGRSTVKVLSDSSNVSVKDLSNTTVATKNVANGIATFILVPGTYKFTSGTKTASVNVGYKKSMTINMMTDNIIAGDTTVVESLTAADGEPLIYAKNPDTGERGLIGADGEFIPFSNARKLYEALQYSGLVTEDMTYQQMIDALIEYFPAYIELSGSHTFPTNNGFEQFETYAIPGEYELSGFTKCYLTWTATARYYHQANGPDARLSIYNKTTNKEYILRTKRFESATTLKESDVLITLPTLDPGKYEVRLSMNFWGNYTSTINATKIRFTN